MADDDVSGQVGSNLPARARARALTHRLDALERRLARLSAALDGASVTLVPGERLRPPSGPDPALQLQRIAASRAPWELE